MSERVAIVGCGLVGSAWALVFARAGWRVRLYDEEASQLAAAEDRIAANARELVRHELLEDAPPVLARIESRPALEDALENASYVQESHRQGPRRVPEPGGGVRAGGASGLAQQAAHGPGRASAAGAHRNWFLTERQRSE